MHTGLYPASGMLRRLRYEFNLSPEGLDSFLTRATTQAFGILGDADRVRLLAASGVDYLLLEREPEPAALELLEPLGGEPLPGGMERLYRLRRSAPEFRFAGRVYGSESLNQALEQLLDPAFDLRTTTVLAGSRVASSGAGGTVEVLSETAESLHLEVQAVSAGALVVQRAFLPLYRATVNGRPAKLVAADLHRMAIELEAGTHEVRIRADRRPVYSSLPLALAGGLLLTVGAARIRRSAISVADGDPG
jgi:hypothetical protein